jgi:exopolysaccharide biosynthesis WecB/TagA/CpsF family protein
VIRLLSLAERFNRTVYLLGGRKDAVEKAERNLRDSFRGLRLVGRHAGYFPKSQEKNVLLAIKKATPTFLLVGSGLPGRDLWVDDCFELFSGKKKSNRPASGNLLGLATGLAFWILVFFARIAKR